MKVISVHSVSGGVGKTTIALSSAIQLAKSGSKVALIELPSNSVLRDRLNLESNLINGENYRGLFSGEIQIRSNDLGFGLQKLYFVVSDSSLSSEEVFNDRHITTSVGRSEFHGLLSQLLSTLRNQEFDHVFFDSHPGLSYFPGVQLSFMLDDRGRKYDQHVWFACGPKEPDIRKTLYELNIYWSHMKDVWPKIIVNYWYHDHEPNIVSMCTNHFLFSGGIENIDGLKGGLVTLPFDNTTRVVGYMDDLGRMVNREGLHREIWGKLLVDL